MPTGKATTTPRIDPKSGFNPCSSGWCLPAVFWQAVQFCLRVSILVLLDDAYRLKMGKAERIIALMFQSLFFWMMPTGLFGKGIHCGAMKVSILVLLDDAYRHWRTPSPERRHICFNPCSSGWCLPALSAFSIRKPSRSVSILVLLDDAYRPYVR